MVAVVAFGVPVCPRGRVTFKSDERHIGRDALTDPATELWGEEVLESFFWRGKSSKVGRRVSTCGVM